jgi:hypothetical protein
MVVGAAAVGAVHRNAVAARAGITAFLINGINVAPLNRATPS